MDTYAIRRLAADVADQISLPHDRYEVTVVEQGPAQLITINGTTPGSVVIDLRLEPPVTTLLSIDDSDAIELSGGDDDELILIRDVIRAAFSGQLEVKEYRRKGKREVTEIRLPGRSLLVSRRLMRRPKNSEFSAKTFTAY